MMQTILRMSRIPEYKYEDPLDRLWLDTALAIGFSVRRSTEVYASTNGKGVLTIGAPETLDSDDSLAQMIFHELCHSLVEGRESLEREDWGLSNYDDTDQSREYACLRLQAALATPRGLRWFFAPTTEHRPYYDALPEDPLPPGRDPVVNAARSGAALSELEPWAPHLVRALDATRDIAQAMRTHTHDRSSLWSQVVAVEALHKSGFPTGTGDRARQSCASCAWFVAGKTSNGRCRQAGVRLDATLAACERWEPALDCQSCGACCREAYGAVEVSARDPFAKQHPELLVLGFEGRKTLQRNGSRCAHLMGGNTPDEKFECNVYEDRPRTCRDFTLGSDHCLTARRRVGLSR